MSDMVSFENNDNLDISVFYSRVDSVDQHVTEPCGCYSFVLYHVESLL